MTAPPTTSPLPGNTATFTWDAGAGVNFYWLYVGTTPGGTNLFSSGAWGTTLSQTVNNLPQTGQPVYVRLYSSLGDTLLYRDYVYTTAQTAAPAPDITVQQPAGTNLADGAASLNFGNVNVGSSSAALTFTILNSGTASLTGLSINKDGANSADFAVGDLGATTLAPNASTTFNVTFTPGGAGARSAAIHIASNVNGSKNPFDIQLSGSGVTAGGTTDLPLAQALDNSSVTWTTGGNANWTSQTVITHDGAAAAQTGKVAESQETWFQTTVTGPGTFSFWWKVDSFEDVNYLNFDLDGAVQFFISGSVDWEQRTVPVAAGNHTLRWAFDEDVGGAGTNAGWVDQVKWAAETGSANGAILSYGATPGKFTLTWPITGDQYQLEYTDSPVSPNWIPVPETPSTVGDQFVVTVAAGETARFFRLRRR